MIGPRVAAADRSCNDAQAALGAYLGYQRQRQLLGLDDDPEFDLYGPGVLPPSDLVDTAVERCFEEQYRRCVTDGDFGASAAYFLRFFRHESLLGVEPKAEHLTLADGYLKRCGRWRIRLATTVIDDAPPVDATHLEATREFYLQWQPSPDGEFGGIIGSTITGSGPVETTLLKGKSLECKAMTAPRPSRDATAMISALTFAQPEGPTQSGDLLPPVPTKLTVTADLGAITFEWNCVVQDHPGEDQFQWSVMLSLHQQGVDYPAAFARVAQGALTATFDRDWRFDTGPYRATLVQEDTIHPTNENSVYVRNEIVVEHSPK